MPSVVWQINSIFRELLCTNCQQTSVWACMKEKLAFVLDNVRVRGWNIQRQRCVDGGCCLLYSICVCARVCVRAANLNGKRRWWKHATLYGFAVYHLSGPFSMQRCISHRICSCVANAAPIHFAVDISHSLFIENRTPFLFIFRRKPASELSKFKYINDPYSMAHCMSTRVPFVTSCFIQAQRACWLLSDDIRSPTTSRSLE